MSIDLSQLNEVNCLKPRHKTFVLRYISSGNAKQSYIDAGYSKRSASVNAYRTLEIASVKQAIEACERAIVQDAGVTTDWIVNNLRKIVETGKNDSDRIRCLELLGKWKGIFKDQQTNIALFGAEQVSQLVDSFTKVSNKLSKLDNVDTIDV